MCYKRGGATLSGYRRTPNEPAFTSLLSSRLFCVPPIARGGLFFCPRCCGIEALEAADPALRRGAPSSVALNARNLTQTHLPRKRNFAPRSIFSPQHVAASFLCLHNILYTLPITAEQYIRWSTCQFLRDLTRVDIPADRADFPPGNSPDIGVFSRPNFLNGSKKNCRSFAVDAPYGERYNDIIDDNGCSTLL